MSETLWVLIITGMISILSLLITKIFDDKRNIREKNSTALKEFRVEKIKAYSILLENIEDIDVGNLETLKDYNSKFFYKHCYAFIEINTCKKYLKFDTTLRKYIEKLTQNEKISEVDVKNLGEDLAKLIIQVREDVQKDKENILKI